MRMGSLRTLGRLPRRKCPRGPGARPAARRPTMSAALSTALSPGSSSSVAACMTEAARPPATLGQRGRFHQLGPHDVSDHELRDAVAPLQRDRLLAEVREDDAHLAAI